MKRRRLKLLISLGVVLGVCIGFQVWFTRSLAAMPEAAAFYYRQEKPAKIGETLRELNRLGVVRDPGAMRLYSWMHKGPGTVAIGTYRVTPGQTAQQIIEDLQNAVRQNVRLPETNWARRNANLLQRAEVTSAKDYLALVNNPQEFAHDVDFPLPSTTLEGYLYPDTYDFPPLLGAHTVIDRQLKAFDTKVYRKLGMPKDLNRIITEASLIELEAGRDKDRYMIAGVIENRLKKGMALELDAGIMYALGKWRRLYFKDYREVKSPYNLYLHKGLPPTPICSPSFKSIKAAMYPAHHEFLFYVALPGGESLYSKTFEEHQKKIKIRLKAIKDRAKLLTPASKPIPPPKPHSG